MAGIYIHLAEPPAISEDQPNGEGPGEYARAIAGELSSYAESHASNETIESIYIGGNAHEYREDHLRLTLESLFSHFDTINLQEVTLEVLPGMITRDRWGDFLALGINRVQILAGSFFDEDLTQLNAPYLSHQVLDAIDDARASGVKQIGIDLSLDIPNQPFEYWGANLEKANHWRIDHVAFHRRHSVNHFRWPQPHQRYYGVTPLSEAEKERHQLAMDYFTSVDYEHYLWLEFARSSARSTLSQLYVIHANILGIGAGAHSFWWHGSSHSRAARWANVSRLERYTALLEQNQLPIDAKSWFDLDALGNEHIMLQLQTQEGLNTLHLETEYGIDLFSEKIEVLASLEASEWIEPIRNNRVRLTPAGKLNYPLVYHQLLLSE